MLHTFSCTVCSLFQRHTAEGRQTELENQIRATKRELQSDMYKGAADKYRNKMIDLRVQGNNKGLMFISCFVQHLGY